MTLPGKINPDSYWRPFLKSAQRHFFELISGGVLQGMISIFLAITLFQMPPDIFLVVIGVYACIASFRAWREEKMANDFLAAEKVRLEDEINTLSLPLFKITILRVLMGTAVQTEKNIYDGRVRVTSNNTVITPMVGVQNTGAPSIALNWRLRVELANVTEPVDVFSWCENDGINFPMAIDGGFSIPESDFIINKAGPGNPIRSGDMITGAASFVARSVTQEVINVAGTKLIVECEDIQVVSIRQITINSRTRPNM